MRGVTVLAHVKSLLSEKDRRDEQRFQAQTSAINAALTAAEKAVTKAEAATEKRFDCVAADTPILCADLVWRPAGELVAGDTIIAFDEESPKRRGRMFRRATVVANSLREDALLRVSTPLGDVLCNAEHPWLVRRPRSTKAGTADGIWAWIKSADLSAGDEVLHVVDVWQPDSSWEGGWLAGMFDGEGCLSLNKNGGAQLSLAQRESATSTRISDALKSRVRSFVSHRQEAGTRSTRYNTVPFFHFIISSRADILKMLGVVRPPRLMPKSDGVWEGKPIGGKHRRTQITAIAEAGMGTISVLGTSSRTYIAAGFAMHNSVNEFRKTLSDQAAGFISRVEFDALKERMDRGEGRGNGLKDVWGWIVGAAGLVVAAFAYLK